MVPLSKHLWPWWSFHRQFHCSQDLSPNTLVRQLPSSTVWIYPCSVACPTTFRPKPPTFVEHVVLIQASMTLFFFNLPVSILESQTQIYPSFKDQDLAKPTEWFWSFYSCNFHCTFLRKVPYSLVWYKCQLSLFSHTCLFYGGQGYYVTCSFFCPCKA